MYRKYNQRFIGCNGPGARPHHTNMDMGSADQPNALNGYVPPPQGAPPVPHFGAPLGAPFEQSMVKKKVIYPKHQHSVSWSMLKGCSIQGCSKGCSRGGPRGRSNRGMIPAVLPEVIRGTWPFKENDFSCLSGTTQTTIPFALLQNQTSTGVHDSMISIVLAIFQKPGARGSPPF